jgi:hypothetical protein
MPSKKKMNQRNKKKGVKNDVRGKTQRLDHKVGTPEEKKLLYGRKAFAVQDMLGRPLRKYNLIISQDDGDWFSSEDDLKDGFIMSVLRKREQQYPNGCGNWDTMYLLRSHGLKENQRFLCYCDITEDRRLTRDSPFDKFEYITWKQIL